MSDAIVSKAEEFERAKKFITSKKSLSEIAMALPSHLTAEKMARVVLTAMLRTPDLLKCSPESVMDAVMQASQLGLLPDSVLGYGYILPYRNKATGRYHATFIPGYKGLIDLARRSGEILWLQARPVYENDDFGYEYGMSNTLWHTPAAAKGEDPGPFKCVYAVAKFKSGEYQFEVMYKDDIEDIRRRSSSRDSGPWVTDKTAMALKTVIRRLCKFLPLNPEHQDLIARDEYAEAGVLETMLSEAPDPTETTRVEQSGLDILTAQLLEEEPEPEPEPPKPKKVEPPPPPIEEPPPEDENIPDPEPPGDIDPKSDLAEPIPFASASSGGRLSKTEDEKFLDALEDLKVRMSKVVDDELIYKTITNRCGVYGAERPVEIRSRLDREKFYLELRQMCEQWEALRRMKNYD